jgi:hypothetical protein
MTRKTREAARELGMTITRLKSFISNDKIAPPKKDCSGDFIWTDNDIERARQAAGIDRRLKAHRGKREEVHVAVA